MSLLSDEQLIKKYLDGDEESLALLIERYFKLIYSFIFRSISNREEAEDLTQEVFLKAWSSIKRFDQQKSFKTWIYTIARNRVIDFLRKKKNTTISATVDEDGEAQDILSTIADERISALAELEQQELNEELMGVLSKLSPEERMLVLLYHQEEMSFREIAEIFKESVDTVKSRHRRALIKLKKYLNFS